MARVSGLGPPSGRRMGPPSVWVITIGGQLRQAWALIAPLGVVGSAPFPAPAARRFIVPAAPSPTLAASTRAEAPVKSRPMSGPVPSPFSLTIGAVVENPSRVLRPV